MKIEIVHPRVLVIQYRQERNDPNYGSCLWLRCTLNLDAHSINIESDCGTYNTGGFACRDFLEFCAGLGRDCEYLLGKVSRRTRIDHRATFDNVAEYLEDVFDVGSTMWGEIEAAVYGAEDERGIIEEIESLMDREDISVDEYDLYECITHDYPESARRAIQIFCEHIVPVIADEEKKKEKEETKHGKEN